MKSTKMILSAALVGLMTTSSAMAEDPAAIEPITLGDSRMTCDALVGEANAMQTILGGAPEGGVFGSERMVDIGTGLAAGGLVHSGAINALGGRAAGAIGFLGRAAKASAKRKEEAAAARKESALRRWYYIVGLYQGKDCDNQPATAPVTTTEE
ncbi:MAG: hypothetical protein COA47_02300 [Robiginitomaculum sp.]|nr:MAG: hypothetical protein COA47_02300 [Robiginitomaculum sp.]